MSSQQERKGMVSAVGPKPCERRRSGGRTQLEDRERAFIAASRRSDRSAEARLQSAQKASEVHFQRTGRRLKVTPQIVEAGEQYESEDDVVTKRIKRGPNLAGDGASSYIAASHAGVSRMVDDAELRRREMAVDFEFARVFPQFQQRDALSFPQRDQIAQQLGYQRLVGRSCFSPVYLPTSLASHQQASVQPPQSPIQPPLEGWRDTRRQSAPQVHQGLGEEAASVYPEPVGSPIAFDGWSSPAGPHRPKVRSASVGTPLLDQHTPELSSHSCSGTPSMTPSSGGSPLDFSSQFSAGQTDLNIDPILFSELHREIKDLISADSLGIEPSDFGLGTMNIGDIEGIDSMNTSSQEHAVFVVTSPNELTGKQQSSGCMLGDKTLSNQGAQGQQPDSSNMAMFWPAESSVLMSPRDIGNDVQFDEFLHSE